VNRASENGIKIKRIIHIIDGEGWSSGDIMPGQSFSKTFDTAGDFKYQCRIHPSMKGELKIY